MLGIDKSLIAKGIALTQNKVCNLIASDGRLVLQVKKESRVKNNVP